ncbi:MAG: penicillin-insensitive murein endopeptidase, partial [Gaiellaceae bacterium]
VEASLGDLSRAAAAALAPQPLADGSGSVALPAPTLRPNSRERGYRDSRRQQWSPRRRRRFATRFVPAATLIVSAAVTLPSLLSRDDRATRVSAAALATANARSGDTSTPLLDAVSPAIASSDALANAGAPPFSALGLPEIDISAGLDTTQFAPELAAETPPSDAVLDEPAPAQVEKPRYEKIVWRKSAAHGVPFGGHLHNGVALPIEGPDWITWDPTNNVVPNRAWRLHGTDKLVRTIVRVARAHRAANPGAPPLLIGDLSATEGGPLDQHVSHQNGLDVDIYYPRKDGKPTEPTSTDQIDIALAQDLVDRFTAAGAQFVFVGYTTPLTSSAARPYPNHENHMHVRLRP